MAGVARRAKMLLCGKRTCGVQGRGVEDHPQLGLLNVLGEVMFQGLSWGPLKFVTAFRENRTQTKTKNPHAQES